jgi:hypothetical protein
MARCDDCPQTKAEREVKRLRGLAQEIVDALDAEKTPDFGDGYELALRAALAMLGKQMKPIQGRAVSIHEVAASEEVDRP